MPTTRSETNATPMSASPEQQGSGREGSEVTLTTATDPDQPQNPEKLSTPNLKITNLTGGLTIDPPDNSIIIHSVNCLGEWGSGVALALAKALPGAYQVYRDKCNRQTFPGIFLGQAYLIPPQKGDYDLTPAVDGSDSPSKPRRWVCCLFVSEGYGRATKTKPGKAKPVDIIRHTKKALEYARDVLSMGQRGEVVDWGSEIDEDGREAKPNLDVIWACKFNSGSFGVKWETTLDIIKDIFQEDRNGGGWKGEIRVVSRD